MENNSKQAVLSIVGIAILVIAVVGVSFAFFTYSRTGTTNNVITTGKIEFVYTEDTALSLTNQFPQSDVDGSGNDQFTFHVTGTIPATANAIDYQVYAVAGDTMDGKTRMKDSDINVYVTGDGTIVGGYDTNDGTNVGAVAGNTTGTNRFQIAEGTITNSGVQETHDYTLTMWVNESVTISDTDASADYRASSTEKGDLPAGQNTDTRKVYTDMYYSLKVNVEAND